MIEKIFETPQAVKDLEKWSLVNQYKKAKIQILAGNFSGNRLKLREPKSEKIYYFRFASVLSCFIISSSILMVVAI